MHGAPAFTTEMTCEYVLGNMVAVKYKRRLLLAPFVLFTMYVLLTDMEPIASTEGWMQLSADITNTSIYRNKRLNTNDGHCIITDSTTRKLHSMDFRVIVITYDRPYPLLRLLESLDRADYGGDRVVIDIWLDRSKLQLVHNETLQSALDFKFSKGRCNVYVHPVHVGITGQWLSTWSPASKSSEIAVILEDDLTVSPHFYSYLKLVHQKYGNRRDIYGFSLQGSSMKHSDGKCCLKVPLEHKVFLYPTLGTSGFSPKSRNWLQFLAWFKEVTRQNIDVIPFIENHIAVKWYKELERKGKADSMWEMEYLYYTQSNKEFTLYPNFPDQRGFTFNWFEDGLHSTGESIKDKKMEYNSLVMEWTLNYDQLPDNPIYLDNDGIVIG
ncbi:uncharacterized protein LOC123556349 isoform X2 [Mercenaria mercenaria]|uniref:uncharacterized protein LOC123556349 isoform X2 n=1 Tax=Mercenaria mercenaria TaxID=6596 RepID=UPI00234F830A|nr:uncharacterized protein LOC123556349 isoform X2 [Mercenaria mercenaria]